MAPDLRHVLFRVGGERFALPLGSIREVVNPQPPFARVPRAPDSVRGAMNLRGRVVAVVRDGERFLLVRNPEASELLAGVWEFPWTMKSARRADWEAELGRSYGGDWRIGRVRGRARHAITFRSLRL